MKEFTKISDLTGSISVFKLPLSKKWISLLIYFIAEIHYRKKLFTLKYNEVNETFAIMTYIIFISYIIYLISYIIFINSSSLFHIS